MAEKTTHEEPEKHFPVTKDQDLTSIPTEHESSPAASEWQATFDAMNAGVWILDRDHRILRSNKAVKQMFSHTHEEMVGKHCWEIVHGTDQPIPECPALRVKESLRRERMELVIDNRWVEVAIDPIFNKNGELAKYVHIITDITERKQAEAAAEKLEAENRHLQKAESLKRMAGAIAHHFNNQLTTVIGNLEMALEEQAQNGGLLKNLTKAMQASLRASEVSGLMLTYLGQTTAKQAPIDISGVCQRSLPLLRSIIPKAVLLEVDLPTIVPLIRGNVNQIEQVLINLVTNAGESMPGGKGTIDLTVKTVSGEDISRSNCYPIRWRPEDMDYVCLAVADAGCGITGKDMEKIFDPFFTKKFPGRGLGLSVVLGILRAHNSAITVESTPGEGSVFRVFLPVLSEERFPMVKSDTVLRVKFGGTVLLAEDEESVRIISKAMLEFLGYNVLEAKDGYEAVELFRQHKDDIRFVLCNFTMPKLNGAEVLAALRKVSPGIPFILSSGYYEEKGMLEGQSERYNVFLHKPFSMKELATAIEQTLVSSH